MPRATPEIKPVAKSGRQGNVETCAARIIDPLGAGLAVAGRSRTCRGDLVRPMHPLDMRGVLLTKKDILVLERQ